MGTVYRFGDFQLDSGNYELLRSDRAVKLERKPMELLILLTSRQGQLVTRAEIAERLWAKEIYVDVEHGINTAVRKLRHALRDDSIEPKFIKTVTGVGYRFVAPLITEPALEVAPQEVADAAAYSSRPDPAVPAADRVPGVASGDGLGDGSRSESSIGLRRVSRRALWLGAAGVLILLIAFGVWKLWLGRSPAVIHSLAVLPLDNLSGDAGQDYLAAGMTDELTTMVARNSTLRVTSRTSVMQYKGAHRPISEIARALGVDGIVEGSIARKGDRMHMTLQLIRADTDSHLWAESFDRDANDPSLAWEAAQKIADRLQSAIPVTTAQRYVNPSAHDAYLHGRYLWLSSRDDESGPYYKKAIEIQPDYAAAWAGLADYYGKAAVADELDPRVALPLEEKASARALALDPNLAEAHQAMAGTYLVSRWDPANADREILQAISLDPNNGDLYAFRADVMLVEDRRPEAVELAKKAVEMAPLEHAPWLGWIYMDHRQYDAALDDLKVRLEATPADSSLLYCRMECLRRKGSYKEAADAAAKFFLSFGDPKDASALRAAFAKGGWPAVVRWQLAFDTARQKREYVSPVILARYHAELGEKEPALSQLEEGFRQHDFAVLMIATDPAFDFLRGEPRFQSLVQRIGLPVTSVASRNTEPSAN